MDKSWLKTFTKLYFTYSNARGVSRGSWPLSKSVRPIEFKFKLKIFSWFRSRHQMDYKHQDLITVLLHSVYVIMAKTSKRCEGALKRSEGGYCPPWSQKMWFTIQIIQIKIYWILITVIQSLTIHLSQLTSLFNLFKKKQKKFFIIILIHLN